MAGWSMGGAGPFAGSRREASAADSVWDKLSMVNSLFAPKTLPHLSSAGGGVGNTHQPLFQARQPRPPSHTSSQEHQREGFHKLPNFNHPVEREDSQETRDDESVESKVINFSTAAAAPRAPPCALSRSVAEPLPSKSSFSAGGRVAPPTASIALRPIAAVPPAREVSGGDVVMSHDEVTSEEVEGWVETATLSRLLSARVVSKTFLVQSFSPQEIKDIRAALCGPTLQKNTLKAANVTDIVSACPATDPKTFVAAIRKAAKGHTLTSLPANPSTNISTDYSISHPPAPIDASATALIPTASSAVRRDSATPAALQNRPGAFPPSTTKPQHTFGRAQQEPVSGVTAAKLGAQGVGVDPERALWNDAQWHSHLLMRLKQDKVLTPFKRFLEGGGEARASKRGKEACFPSM
uniref:Uncharacterized protein n=2 Tax=Hemiselmis andersenii TaxID=464988 RepID=A0A7S0U8W0_HEMAN